jgi:membrane-associated phospholipid phosphatase
MYDSQCYFAVFLLIVILYHKYILSDIEKQFAEKYFGYDAVKRPLSGNVMKSVQDLGMPSGHAETATIMFSLLYFNKYLPLWLCILLIFIASLQRLLTHRHTIIQVIAGIVCGLIYTYIYTSYNLSIFSFSIVILISLLLTALIYYKAINE